MVLAQEERPLPSNYKIPNNQSDTVAPIALYPDAMLAQTLRGFYLPVRSGPGSTNGWVLQSRESASRARPPKVAVTTRVSFDEEASAHSTLLEVVTQDRAGLLYDMGSALARLDCNIEVALIDTEGQKAIDVFYLTSRGNKLDSRKQDILREVLQGTLG